MRNRRRGLHGHPHSRRPSHDDRRAGDGADGDAPDVTVGERQPLPFNDARYSGLSVGVPGTVETWADALEDYGTMSLAEVFAPAIHVARHGYVIDQVWFDQVNANRDWFDDIPASAALFLDPDGTPRNVGTVFTNPALAETYERIAHLGAKGFYRGAVADALVETVRHPVVSPSANHVWRSGVMKMRDLHTYAAQERAPTHVNYRGLDVYSMGPPSSGGSTVGEALNILEGYNLASMTRRPPCTTTSRPRATPSRTATRTSPIRPTSTCLSPGCSRMSTRRPGAR